MENFILTRDNFSLPKDIIYLNGNSLGPLPRATAENVQKVIKKEWGELLIDAWNEACWIDTPTLLGEKIAKIIKAPPNTVVVGETLSIRLYQVLDAAIQLSKANKSTKTTILTDTGNFPTDRYIAQSLANRYSNTRVKTVPPDKIFENLNQDISILFLTEVDFKTGRLHDMQKINMRAKNLNIITIWDLAHSAGVIDINVKKANVDFAVGCTYKYLCGGPGSPAFLYTKKELLEGFSPTLTGWMGHEHPFSFKSNYTPARGISKFRIGTPEILQMAALESSLKIWNTIDVSQVRETSRYLTDVFIKEVKSGCPNLVLASPENSINRGSHVSFYSANGYPIIQALRSNGIIGDFREPNLMRFGFNPLFNSKQDAIFAAETLCRIILNREWEKPNFLKKKTVT